MSATNPRTPENMAEVIDTQKPDSEAVDPASAGSARFGGFIGPPIDFREWWESKDHTYEGDATPMAIAGLAWEAAHRKYAPGNWDTSCGQCMCFEHAPPAFQGYKFCHHCGLPINFIKFIKPLDESPD